MKTPSSPVLRLVALALTIFLPVTFLRAEVNELRVTARPTVEYAGRKPPSDAELQQARVHQRIYVLAHLEEVKSFEKLVKPVNEPALAAQLRKALSANGYIEAAAHGPKPEIVLSVYYGRGWPPNIYLGAAQLIPNKLDGPDTYNLDVPTAKDVATSSGPGHDEKAARASYEKLMILVLAVKYPSHPLKPGQNPERLWKTLIYVDDPDHRDLNAVMPEMLATGGAFFGQHIDQMEAETWKPLPEGRVILGEIKTLDDVPAPTKK